LEYFNVFNTVKIQDDPENAKLPIPKEMVSGVLIVKEIFLHQIIGGPKFSWIEVILVSLVVNLLPVIFAFD
jgi:hypothetical protein